MQTSLQQHQSMRPGQLVIRKLSGQRICNLLPVQGPRPVAPAAVPFTKRQHRAAVRLQARSASTAAELESFVTGNPVGQLVAGLVGTPVFLATEVIALLVMLALTDAAYSGDWSRIGVISAETEPLLQKIAILAWSLHAGCGVLAANIARSKGRSAGSAAVKGFLFGSLHVFEELVLQPAGAQNKAAVPRKPASQRPARRR